MNISHAIILALIEGLTEFLPISSTGHMILASTLLKLQDNEFLKTFEISIQLGAILAIVILYARRLLWNPPLYKKLAAAFVPTAVVGFALYGIIKTYLFNPVVVSIALIAGGILLIAFDKMAAGKKHTGEELEKIPYRRAFLIGLCQSVSVIPGVSRAAATIIGGMVNGLSKKQAMEFSFLLAIPTMLAATGYDLLKTSAGFSGQELLMLGIGGVVAFISALAAVKFFINFVEKRGFAFFGYYRIALGIIFLLYFFL